MAGFDESRPIFLQLAEMLEDGIISGAFPEEGQIPSITEYSAALKITQRRSRASTCSWRMASSTRNAASACSSPLALRKSCCKSGARIIM